MKPIDEIIKLFNSYPEYGFDPEDFNEKAGSILVDACEPGADYDPRDPNKRNDSNNAYGQVANLLSKNGFRSASESLLINAWNEFGKIQREESRRIYRAGISMYLSRLYLGLNDTGAATRWALLTQADDILGEHSGGGGAGRKMLLTILGMAEDELSDFNSIASDNLNEVLKDDDWSKPEAFAEDVVVRFALRRPEASHLLAAISAVSEYPLSSPYFASLLHAIDSVSSTTKGKGDTLEDLATYLFLLIPAFSPRRNVKDIFDTFETDIVVRNLSTSADPLAEILGRHILVECKNWKDPVGVSHVGYFLYRMRLTHVAFGVIFATNGITGSSEEEKAARSIIRKAFHEDGSICVIISKSDLEDLQTKSSSFRSVLLEKAEQVRFGKALYSG